MSKNPVDENFYEQALIELFQEMGYQYEYGPDVERDYRDPFHVTPGSGYFVTVTKCPDPGVSQSFYPSL